MNNGNQGNNVNNIPKIDFTDKTNEKISADKEKLIIQSKIKQLEKNIMKQEEIIKQKQKDKYAEKQKQIQKEKDRIESEIQELQKTIHKKQTNTKSEEHKLDANKIEESKIEKEQVTDKTLLLINLLKNAKASQQENKISKEIIIKSQEHIQPEGYSNYLVELEEEIKCKDLNINVEFPINKENNITEENNQIHIKINNEDIYFELEPDFYNRYELCECITDAFKQNNLNIMCTFNENYYEIHNVDNINFSMFNDDNSILSILGFTKNSYLDKSVYSGDVSPNIGDNIYYIEIDEIFRFKVNADNVITKLHDKLDDFYTTSDMSIKIKKTENSIVTDNKQYSYFFEKPHVIKISLFFT